jgi:hypothetical protein
MLDHPEWLNTVWQLQQQFGPNTFGLPYREKGPECSDTDHPSEVLKTVFNNGILPDCKDVKNGNDGSNNDAPKTCRDTSKDTPDTNKRSTVYDTFCKGLGKDHKAMIVDGHGYPIGPRKRPLLEARTPPVYSDPNIQNTLYTFALVWEGGDGSCDFDCLKTWDTITSSCGHYGAGQNLMTMKGSYETGCGKYWYQAEPPPKSGPVKTLPKCTIRDLLQAAANGGGLLNCSPN